MFFRSIIFIIALWSSAACACSDHDAASAIAPLSAQNNGTVGTASQAADILQQELPDDPRFSMDKAAAKKVKHKLFTITLSAQAGSVAPKTQVIDLSAEEYAAVKFSSNPEHNQAVADLLAASALYESAVKSLPACAPSDKACAQAEWNMYLGNLRKNKSMNEHVKELDGSILLGQRLSDLYHTNSGVTPLPTMLQALITNSINAGECRDIASFISLSLGDQGLGMKNCGVTAAVWNNDAVTGAHVIADCQETATGHYVFFNYDELFDSQDKIFAEAAQKAALALNPYTDVVHVQSASSIDSKGAVVGKLVQLMSPRAEQIQQNIDRASDPNRPNIQVDLGNYESSVGGHVKIVGDDHNSLGAWGAANINRQGDAYDSEAFGLRADLSKTIQTSQNTAVILDGNSKNGGFRVADQNPSGNSNTDSGARTTSGFLTNTTAEAKFGWNESGQPGNSGHVSAQANVQDALFGQGGYGKRIIGAFMAGNIPYDTITITAVDNPSKSVTLHASNQGFVSLKSEQDLQLAYHQAYFNGGTKISHSFGGGKYDFSTDTTVYDFGDGAYGLTNKSEITLRSKKWGDVSATGNVGKIQNGSPYSIFDYPTTCEGGIAWDKSVGRVQLHAYGDARCNAHNAFDYFHLDDPDGMITPKTRTFGFEANF